MVTSIKQMLTEKVANIQYDLQIMYYSLDVDFQKIETEKFIDRREDMLHLILTTLMLH